jgi:hypothetical protein
MGLWEVGCKDIGWIQLAQHADRWRTLVNPVMKILIP